MMFSQCEDEQQVEMDEPTVEEWKEMQLIFDTGETNVSLNAADRPVCEFKLNREVVVAQ